MEAGDFYASTGVSLKELAFEHNKLSVEVNKEAGVSLSNNFHWM